MIDTDKYQSIRFTDNFNCADFVRLVALDYGIDYPIGGVNHETNEKVFKAISEKRSLFKEVKKPKSFDLVYMKSQDQTMHVGIYFNYGKIYHLQRKGSPIMQKITAEFKSNIIGFYRLKDA